MATAEENRLAFKLYESPRAANDPTKHDTINKIGRRKDPEPPDYLHSVNQENVTIVIRRSEFKTIIDVSVTVKMTLIYYRKISAFQSCADGSRPSPTGTSIWFALGTEIGVEVCQGAVSEIV